MTLLIGLTIHTKEQNKDYGCFIGKSLLNPYSKGGLGEEPN